MRKKTNILQEAIERAQHRRSLPSPVECRLLRLRAGLSQSEIAESIGTTAATVSRYETGHRCPRGPILDRYIAACEELVHVNKQSA
jgi:DNA-binding transcriptional regulator YiaG